MANYLLVAKQVAILFVLIGAGVLCRKAKLVDEFSIRGMVNVLMLIVTPAVVIDCFQRPFDPAMLRQLGLAFVLATAAHGLAIALAYLTAHGDERTQPVLRLATVFSNAGFMGIPLEYAILGATGVFYGIVYVAMFNVFMWSWGLAQMRGEVGERTTSVRQQDIDSKRTTTRSEAKGDGRGLANLKMFVNPGTVGIAIGVPLFLFSLTLPEIIGKPIHALAELNTPLAMLVIGYYLAGADLKAIVREHGVYKAAYMRLVVFPLLVLGGLYLVRGWLDRTMALAIVTAASAPVAALVTVFAAKYNRAVDMSVGLVSGTTLLSVLTMPAMIALAMEIL